MKPLKNLMVHSKCTKISKGYLVVTAKTLEVSFTPSDEVRRVECKKWIN